MTAYVVAVSCKVDHQLVRYHLLEKDTELKTPGLLKGLG